MNKFKLGLVQHIQQGVATPLKGQRSTVAAISRAQAQPISLSLGWLPALSFLGACGLLLVSIAHSCARAEVSWAEPLFWFGLMVLILPIFFRLLAIEASRQERLGLVIFLGLGLYISKILHSPYAFTFPDEFHHTFNINKIIETRHLFNQNYFLPVTPYYPGLSNITFTLVALTGLSNYVAGLIVIGTARFVLSLGLFLLYERLSGSPRAAGLGAGLYMANANFLFWSAQYSYESFALPIGILLLFTLVERELFQHGQERIALSVIILALLTTIIVSHHMTSYALCAFLWGACIVAAVFVRVGYVQKKVLSTMLNLAVLTSVAALTWLIFVANLTISYLSPVLTGAVNSIVQLIIGEGTSRELFTSTSGYVSPLWERVEGLGSVVLILVGLPFGLWPTWRLYRRNVFVVVLALAALMYFPMLAMRLTSAGWETSNRAAAFLYVGIAFVLGLGTAHFCSMQWSRWYVRIGLTLCASTFFIGGAISGWPPSARMGRTYLVDAQTALIEPPSVAVAQWTRTFLGTDNRFAADPSNAKVLFAYGGQNTFTGTKYGIAATFASNQIGRTEEKILKLLDIKYVVVDRRTISWDQMIGIYFNHTTENARQSTTLEQEYIYNKFDKPGISSRLLDSGDIVLYDVGVLTNGSAQR